PRKTPAYFLFSSRVFCTLWSSNFFILLKCRGVAY
ncbi:MAG: hypothetical protein ACI83Q_000639, partial [Colwellia polaris]